MKKQARRGIRRSQVITVAVASALVLSACAGGGEEPAPATDPDTQVDVSPELAAMQAEGVLRVGIASQPPFSGIKADGTLEGVTPAVIGDVMAELGVARIDAATAPYGQLIPGLQSGRWDLVGAAMSITAERCEQVIFTRPIVWDGGAILYDASRVSAPVNSLADMVEEDLTVGMVVSSFRIPLAIEHGVLESNIVQFPDDPAIYDAIRTGRVDAGFLANSSIAYHLGDDHQFDVVYPVPETPPTPNAMAFRLEDTALAAEFDKAFSAYIDAGELKERQEEFGYITPAGQENLSSQQVCADLLAAS